MKEGWEVKKLGEVATYINGYAFKPEQWVADGVPIIRIQNLNNPNAPYNYCDIDIPVKFHVHKGDILISWSASLGVYEWNADTAYLNQHIFKVVFDKVDINKYYLKYVVNAKLNDMQKQLHGATMKHIVKKDFDNIPIPLPPLPEQEKIVAELDCLSGIIEKKKQQLKELDTLAQSIFYEMFGDPVKNEKGWEVKKLGEVASSELGKMLDTKKNQGEYHPYLCTINVLWNHIDQSQIKEMRIENHELSRYRLQKGDLMICEGGDTGRCAIWNYDEEMYYQNSLHRVRFDETRILPIYCLYTMRFYKIHGEIDKYSTGQTIKHLVKKALLTIPLPIPPLSLQHSFASKIEAIEKQKTLIKQSIAETETLFNSRMQEYFN